MQPARYSSLAKLHSENECNINGSFQNKIKTNSLIGSFYFELFYLSGETSFRNASSSNRPGRTANYCKTDVAYLEVGVLAVVAAVAQVEMCELKVHHVALPLLDDEGTLPSAASVGRGLQRS